MLVATGSSRSGAALMCAMVVGQVSMAMPIERATRRLAPRAVLVGLLVTQAAVMGVLAVSISAGLSLPILIVVAALAGTPNGVIFGLFRLALAAATPRTQLVRRIATSLAVNETIYVSGPVLAAVLGTVAAVLPIAVMASALLVSAALAMRLPRLPLPTRSIQIERPSGAWVVWLTCMLLSSALLAFVEVGAVGIALDLGWAPSSAGFVAAAACLTSGVAGVAVSWGNPRASEPAVFGLIGLELVGVGLVVVADAPLVVLAGCMIVGLGVAPLGTLLSVLGQDATAEEQFARSMALLRMAHGGGIVVAALVLALMPVRTAGGLVAAAVGLVGLGCVALRIRAASES